MKKLKLFLSLCMMCLCIAVLCMGILAAGSATYNINGNISYNMIDGVARVNARVYKVAGTGTLTSDQLTSGYITTLATMELENISKSTSPNYILTETKDTIAINQDGKTVGLSADIVYGANTDQSTYYTYFIVLNITNQSSDTGYVLNAYLSTLGTTSTISNIASNANGGSNKLEIKSGEFSNIVIGLSYTGTTTTSETFSYTLNVLYDKYYSKSFTANFLKEDTKNGYYYTELGTLSDGTNIRWRLVSLDGTSKYIYEANNTPKKHDGAIFLQETYLGSLVYFDASDDTSRTDYNNYYKSDIRTTVTNLDTWNLNESDISSLITKRNITEILGCDNLGRSETQYEGTTDDYFWLLSWEEVKTYLGSKKSDYSWTDSWWLRTPWYDKELFPAYVGSEGQFNNGNAKYYNLAIRAAFQLS